MTCRTEAGHVLRAAVFKHRTVGRQSFPEQADNFDIVPLDAEVMTEQ